MGLFDLALGHAVVADDVGVLAGAADGAVAAEAGDRELIGLEFDL